MIIKLFKSLFFSLLVISSVTHSESKDGSLFIYAAEANKSLPMMVDDITTWKSVGYSDYTNELIYSFNLKGTKATLNFSKDSIKSFSDKATTKFCDSAETRALLDQSRIKANYFDTSGVFLFQIKINNTDC
jgi:hypothetical protein